VDGGFYSRLLHCDVLQLLACDKQETVST